jgi:hypothetical protein
MPENNITGMQQQLPIGRTISLGFKVLFSELHWQILRGLRNWEIKQMRSRLSKEYEKLGKLLESHSASTSDNDRQSEIDLCRKQVDFLSREVEHLQTQLRNLRRDIIARRRKKWNV